MTCWEEGVFCIESEHYIFTENTPYSPPFTFKAILESGEEVEAQNVINSMESGDSGTLSSSDSEMESGHGFDSASYGGSCGSIWIVIPMMLCVVCLCCVFRKSKPTVTVSVEDDTPKKEEAKNTTTTVNGEGAEGMETNETAVEVAVR